MATRIKGKQGKGIFEKTETRVGKKKRKKVPHFQCHCKGMISRRRGKWLCVCDVLSLHTPLNYIMLLSVRVTER